MGKRPTPEQVRWQEAARGRLQLVLDRRFDSNQTRLANALGVSHTLVNLVVRAVQPPTRNLMARLGTIEGVNPHWAASGEGEPFDTDIRCTLPVSDVLLPGVPADHTHLMTGGRFAVAPAYDRPSCYFWRLPSGHPAIAVAGWRMWSGDLLLMEAAGTVTSRTDAFSGKKVVIDGRCFGRAEPAYGAVTADAKARLVFGDDQPRLRFDETPSRNTTPSTSPPPLVVKDGEKRMRRKVRNLEAAAQRTAEKATDPWYALPRFRTSDVLAVQMLLLRV